MFELLYGYLAFALATGILSWLYLFRPCLQEALALGIRNEITTSPKLTSIVWIIMNTVIAPLVLVVILVPSFCEAALVGVRKSMFEE